LVKRTFYIFFAVCSFAAFTGVAQDTAYTLRINLLQEGDKIKQISQSMEDSLQISSYTADIVDSLQREGYFYPEPFVDLKDGGEIQVSIEIGAQTQWFFLGKGNLESWLLRKLNFPFHLTKGRPFSFEEWQNLMHDLLDIGQNNGYPFMAVKLDSIQQSEKGISAIIDMEKGPFISFDTVKIVGNSKTRPIYLAKKLGIKPGEPFSQKKVEDAAKALKNIPFISIVGNPELSFQNEEATVYLPTNDRKINTLDGIIGLLPNEIEANKWLVTGQFDLQLYNVAGRGRDYVLKWQRLSRYSQNLNVEAKEPFVLGTNLDLSASFNLLKEDTTFLNRTFALKIGYQIRPTAYLSFFGKRQAGDLLAVSAYENASKLPEIADFRYNSYGATFAIHRVDDIILPKQGWQSTTTFGLGNKRLLENTGIPPDLYLGVEKTSLQYFIQTNTAYYRRWGQSLGVKLGFNAGDMDNSNLLLNDLFRLGGLQSIRGFNENYFYTNRYFYINLEPRFYFGTYSYFLLFTDMGKVENKVDNAFQEWPISFGGGLNLETSSGIFKFVYAMGQTGSQPLGFNYSRIHFGFTGRF
jgi:outer membrane protein assembly factor BamA